ncbi:Ni/Fe-hydrogenase, b-type cytochrome subunit [Venenivibrio stagnispumantis]|uniref:Ni/Fe-hydrogenase 1 B-type cytochrome subunit n=1 Tax=Venenivibrio stagnispumantis TaxID=407998 RepID=A0AA46AEX7_9AQUI|nr:cytochrome b/b6 domain-containing protein [Venenivibrio stagnispumantis]MCW4573082.1 cytochrome b/b6 domain-containing protein [Venenivibrio stagnispumantis]SMP15203.1 Ni/Fe-hydrogenase 1 B-type cytochrome subunit [Venenivibrio stagnispumantis]
MYEKIKRMSATMRIIHWINAFSIVIAVITGLYIANPYYQALIAEPAAYKYIMAYNRFFHFIAAIFLDVTAIIIAYLYFFSRFEKPYKKLIPNAQNIREFWEVFLNLITLNRRKNFDSSHLDSFNVVWFTILHLMLLLMLFTGFQMYVVGLESGLSAIGSWWPWLLHIATDWTLYVFGGLAGVRIVHHLTMWLILSWVIFHIYYQVWRTIFWKEGDIGIVFGGYKYKKIQ